MTVYVITFIPSLILTIFARFFFLNTKRGKLNKKSALCLFLSFLIVNVVSSIRLGIGTDYFNTYYPMLNSMKQTGTIPQTDLIFRLIFLIIRNLGLSNQSFFVITSTLINAMFFLTILVDKTGNYPLTFSIFIFNCIFFSSLSNIRQMLGIALAIFGFALFYNSGRKTYKNYIITLLFLFLSIFAHISCSVFIPIFILFELTKKLNPKIILTLGVAVLLLSPVFVNIIKYFISLTKYRYFFEVFQDTGSGLGNILIGLSEFAIFVFSFILIYKKKLKQAYPIFIVGVASIFITIFCIIIKNTELYLRLYHLLFAFDMIFVPHLFLYFSKNYVYLGEQGINKNVFINYSLIQNEKRIIIRNRRNLLCNNMCILLFVSLSFSYFVSFFFQEVVNKFFGVIPYQSIFS